MSETSRGSSDMAQPAAWQRPQPVPTSFTTGFWDATKRQELVLQFCTTTGKFQHYPRPLSIYTGRRTLEWRTVSGRGTVFSYTITRRAPPAFRGREPFIVANIELAEGVRFMSNLVDCAVEAVRIGMPVHVVWEPLADGLHYPLFAPDAV